MLQKNEWLKNAIYMFLSFENKELEAIEPRCGVRKGHSFTVGE